MIQQIFAEYNVKDFDEFLRLLEEQGYEIKRGKYISIKGKEQKRFIRLRSLGSGYTEEDLKRILAGEMERTLDDESKEERRISKTFRRKEDHAFEEA